MTLLGLHHPGTSWLHRLPGGWMLLGLLAAGTVLSVVRGPVSSIVAVGVAVVLVLWSRVPLGTWWRSLRGLLLMLALLAAYSTWQQGWERAVETSGDLLAMLLLATLVTATTPIDDLLDAITRGLRPLGRVGVDSERVGLAFALMVRAIPMTLDLAHETRDAARARGLERDPRARLTPLVIRTVAHARATGEALHARGVGDRD